MKDWKYALKGMALVALFILGFVLIFRAVVQHGCDVPLIEPFFDMSVFGRMTREQVCGANGITYMMYLLLFLAIMTGLMPLFIEIGKSWSKVEQDEQ